MSTVLVFIFWFNYADDIHFGTCVSIWYPLLKKCQLHPNFRKSASIKSFSDEVSQRATCRSVVF